MEVTLAAASLGSRGYSMISRMCFDVANACASQREEDASSCRSVDTPAIGDDTAGRKGVVENRYMRVLRAPSGRLAETDAAAPALVPDDDMVATVLLDAVVIAAAAAVRVQAAQLGMQRD